MTSTRRQWIGSLIGAGLVGVSRGVLGEEAVELLQDPHWEQGFKLHDPEPGQHVVIGHLPPAAPDPIWGLSQWSSAFPLTSDHVIDVPGGYGAANLARAVVAKPEEGYLYLKVNAHREYGGRARRHGEPWPHLLAEQRLAPSPTLDQIRSIPFRLQARLAKCEKFETSEYTPSLHAAQYQLFITAQNLNQSSPGYGDYYWFGIQIFDDREDIPRPMTHVDTGTGKLIYAPGGDAYASDSTHSGDWVTFEGDLLPEMLDGLQRAWERDLLADSQDLSDYRIGGMNIGWEVPGIFDVAVELRDFDSRAVRR
jgi:hypothetical protein